MPLAASLAEKVREGVYLLSVDWDLRFSKAYAMKTAAKEALLAEKKEEKDYQVLDELPFYFNGAGYVNKHRTALFLFEEESGKLTRLTKESFDVSSAHLSPRRDAAAVHRGELHHQAEAALWGVPVRLRHPGRRPSCWPPGPTACTAPCGGGRRCCCWPRTTSATA